MQVRSLATPRAARAPYPIPPFGIADPAPIGRESAAGPFSILPGSLCIASEPGLVIEVGGGCLWVPHAEEHCSVGFGAGERAVLDHAGRVDVYATRPTQVRLVWPLQGSAS